ncbi:MAG: glycerophosphodiester phosphodiesterase family protein [Deltaproteobacteria bacterium]
MARLFILATVFFGGCGFLDPAGTPTVVAHRAAAGYWPENSRTAVEGSVARGYPMIEVDVVVTADGVPFLHHDPWVSETLCRRADGSEIGERIFIRDLTAAELVADYRCGGVADPSTPDAEVVSDTVLPLEEFFTIASAKSEIALYLDLKYAPDETVPLDVFAPAVKDALVGVPNVVYVESTFDEGVAAFADTPVKTLRGWPRFPPGGSGVGQAIGAELASTLGFADILDAAHDAGADGVTTAFQVLDWPSARAARHEGLEVVVFTLNSEAELSRYCAWPVDFVISDYPERAPCL